MRRVKWAVRRVRKASYRLLGSHRFRKQLRQSAVKRIVIGASSRYEPGWIPAEKEFLNLLQPAAWEQFFPAGTVDAMLAEHVWEHLTPNDALTAARTCYTYLKPGGYLRIAVPDGLHPDPAYIDASKVGGLGPGGSPNDHKVLYTYQTARKLFERAGFRVEQYEYFDEAGEFHCHPWDERAGKIWRSQRFDHRNSAGRLAYTSIVLDAVKP